MRGYDDPEDCDQAQGRRMIDIQNHLRNEGLLNLFDGRSLAPTSKVAGTEWLAFDWASTKAIRRVAVTSDENGVLQLIEFDAPET